MKTVPMIKYIFQIMLLVCTYVVSNAQKFITLSPREHKSDRHEVVISEGNRVKCKFIDGSKIVGIIDKIMEDSIQINGKKFVIEEIKSIAKRKKGATAIIVGAQIVPALAGAISIAAGNLPIAVGCFVIQIVGSILTPQHDYPLRNIKYKWALEVHDPSNQKVLKKKN